MGQPRHAQRQAPHEAAGGEVERRELHGGEVAIAGLPRLARESEVRDVVDDGEALGEPLGARLPKRGRAAVGAQAGEAARRREEVEKLALVKQRVVAVGAAEQEGAHRRARRELEEVELRGRLQVVVQHPEQPGGGDRVVGVRGRRRIEDARRGRAQRAPVGEPRAPPRPDGQRARLIFAGASVEQDGGELGDVGRLRIDGEERAVVGRDQVVQVARRQRPRAHDGARRNVDEQQRVALGRQHGAARVPRRRRQPRLRANEQPAVQQRRDAVVVAVPGA